MPSAYKGKTLQVATDATYRAGRVDEGHHDDRLRRRPMYAVATTLGLKERRTTSPLTTSSSVSTVGSYQIGNSSFTDKKSREKQVNFVDYFQAGEGVYAKSSSTREVHRSQEPLRSRPSRSRPGRPNRRREQRPRRPAPRQQETDRPVVPDADRSQLGGLVGHARRSASSTVRSPDYVVSTVPRRLQVGRSARSKSPPTASRRRRPRHGQAIGHGHPGGSQDLDRQRHLRRDIEEVGRHRRRAARHRRSCSTELSPKTVVKTNFMDTNGDAAVQGRPRSSLESVGRLRLPRALSSRCSSTRSSRRFPQSCHPDDSATVAVQQVPLALRLERGLPLLHERPSAERAWSSHWS